MLLCIFHPPAFLTSWIFLWWGRYYSGIIFQEIGFSSEHALLVSAGVAVPQLVMVRSLLLFHSSSSPSFLLLLSSLLLLFRHTHIYSVADWACRQANWQAWKENYSPFLFVWNDCGTCSDGICFSQFQTSNRTSLWSSFTWFVWGGQMGCWAWDVGLSSCLFNGDGSHSYDDSFR